MRNVTIFIFKGVAAKIAKKPKVTSRGGVLLVNLEGEYVSSVSTPNLEVKIIGGLSGFKPGKTVRAIFTHFADVSIKTSVNQIKFALRLVQ